MVFGACQREGKRTRLDEGRLEHVGEEGQHRVKRRKVLLLATDLAVLDASEELGEDGQVEDERGGEEGVLFTRRIRSATTKKNKKCVKEEGVPHTR
jgi:hypothetical protein